MAIHWYFDFISPFAYLQWPRIRALAQAHPIEFRPILFAGILDHIGQKGPAEIPAKRVFTYRHVLFKARQRGLPLTLPPAHPFNPLPALRLCVAAGTTADAIGAIFAWIWADGRAADSVEALAPVAARLGIADLAAALAVPGVKAQLRANFDAALAAGVFGVPTLAVDGELFWGDDATDFAEAFLADRALLEDAQMTRILHLPVAAARQG
jgi:2-hydroxychromene-2-carboxylate isomerase